MQGGCGANTVGRYYLGRVKGSAARKDEGGSWVEEATAHAPATPVSWTFFRGPDPRPVEMGRQRAPRPRSPHPSKAGKTPGGAGANGKQAGKANTREGRPPRFRMNKSTGRKAVYVLAGTCPSIWSPSSSQPVDAPQGHSRCYRRRRLKARRYGWRAEGSHE